MKILNLVALAILLSRSIAYGQNLAPNPSFEERDGCPASYNELVPPTETETSVLNWFQASYATPDYFHPCADGDPWDMGVPDNFQGDQAARTGEAYCGFFAMSSAIEFLDIREYIQAKLIHTLPVGHNILVSYWLNRSHYDVRNYGAIDQFGAYFSESSYYELTYFRLDLPAQVTSPFGKLFDDDENWQNVTGSFTATGNENWVTIGNFTAREDMAVPDSAIRQVYYYVEDVCILDMDSIALENILIHDTLKCDDQVLQLKGRRDLNNFLWDDGSTGSTRNVSATGTYWVKSIDSANCRMMMDTFIIGVKPGPPVSLGNDTTLCNLPFMLIPEIDTEEPGEWLSRLWSDGSYDETMTVDTGTYWLQVTTEKGCRSADTVTISYYNMRQNLGEDLSFCRGEPVNIYLQANVPAGATVYWSNGASSPDIIAVDTGTYWVVANLPPCTGSDTIAISYEKCTCWNDIPTAFTPNGDGLNDVFVPVIEAGCPVAEYLLSIYNRWGQRIFVGYTPETSWDGTYNGKPADAGTYMYELKFTGGTRDNRYIKKGDVHLLR